MSDLNPAPMTAERLVATKKALARVPPIANTFWEDWQRDVLSRRGLGVWLGDCADLLAELDRHRGATAAELRGLLKPCAFLGEAGKRMVAEVNAPIYAAAARLGLTL